MAVAQLLTVESGINKLKSFELGDDTAGSFQSLSLTSNQSLTGSENTIIYITSDQNNRELTLPYADTNSGRQYILWNTESSFRVIINLEDTLGGGVTSVRLRSNNALYCHSDGSVWRARYLNV